MLEVKWPENLLINSPSQEDRCAAGHFLSMLYGRLRWRDSLAVEALRLDMCEGDGFLEMPVRRIKTATTKEKVTKFLEVAAPVHGVSLLCWAERWLEQRRSSRLKADGVSPMFPCLLPSGSWTNRNLSNAEANSHLDY